MKLSVLTVPLQHLPADEAFAYLQGLGVEQVELGTGGFTNRNHCNPEILLADEGACAALQQSLADHGLSISALSCHGNPVHPDAAAAERDHRVFVDTCRLAQKLGVETVVTFSGCPGDSPASRYPNWVTCAWPGDFGKILDYQWNEVLIPYWKKAAAIARSYGVQRIALEMHPGFCVYNPASLLRLREAVGPIIGANFDPSHLIWQGIDPTEAIKALAGAIYHFHAKDTRVDPRGRAINGVLDVQPLSDIGGRSWVFRTVGYGTDAQVWKDMLSTLQLIGYDGAVSIEHEDGLMSVREGLEKAVSFLQGIMIREAPATAWWT